MSGKDDREFLDESTSGRMERMKADLQRLIDAGVNNEPFSEELEKMADAFDGMERGEPDDLDATVAGSPTGDSDRLHILHDAADACTTRSATAGRGSPESNFSMIGELWTALGFGFNGGSVPPHAVGLAISALKLARISDNPRDRDSYVDAAGYAACAWECVEK